MVKGELRGSRDPLLSLIKQQEGGRGGTPPLPGPITEEPQNCDRFPRRAMGIRGIPIKTKQKKPRGVR